MLTDVILADKDLHAALRPPTHDYATLDLDARDQLVLDFDYCTDESMVFAHPLQPYPDATVDVVLHWEPQRLGAAGAVVWEVIGEDVDAGVAVRNKITSHGNGSLRRALVTLPASTYLEGHQWTLRVIRRAVDNADTMVSDAVLKAIDIRARPC